MYSVYFDLYMDVQITPELIKNCFSQKQPSRGVLRKSCSESMQQIYRRTLMSKCDFEIALWHGCSSVNLLHIFRTHFLKNTSGWLVLYIWMYDLKSSPKIIFLDRTVKQLNRRKCSCLFASIYNKKACSKSLVNRAWGNSSRKKKF